MKPRTRQAAQVASPAPPAIGTRAGKSTLLRSRRVFPPPCKGGSQVSARTGGRKFRQQKTKTKQTMKTARTDFSWREVIESQNKKRKNHEKSKKSVQSNRRGSDAAAARLLCGSVYLGAYSGSSPRHGALQWHCLGVRSFSVRHGVRAFNTRHQLRTREPIGSLHGDSGILSAPLQT